MPDNIDWTTLAARIRSSANGPQHWASQTDARRAIELLVGESHLVRAVEEYVAGHNESELIRAVLSLIRPISAMTRCYELYRSNARVNTRRAAVELLRAIADHHALPWIEELLDDSDEVNCRWGVGVLDQLLWSELVRPEECEELLRRAESHHDAHIRERAAAIRHYLER